MDSNGIMCAGAGRSGLVVQAFSMRLMHLGFNVHVAGDSTIPAITRDDPLLIGSGSGETGSLALMARKAKKVQAKVGLVTINPYSSIDRVANIVITIPVSTPKAALSRSNVSIQPMGSLFEQAMLLYFDALVMLLMERTGNTENTMFSRPANLE